MPYDFQVLGWENMRGDREPGDPPEDLGNVRGVFVHAWDTENPENQRHFWAFSPGPMRNWNQWLRLIDGLAQMYKIDLDGGGPVAPPPEPPDSPPPEPPPEPPRRRRPPNPIIHPIQWLTFRFGRK